MNGLITRSLRAAGAVALVLLVMAPATAQEGRPPRYLGPDGNPLPLQSPDEVRDFLRTAPILEIEDLSEGITRPRRLTLQEGKVRARAVFKSVDLEREALRLRGGNEYAGFYDRSTAEIAAYEMAVLLGIHMIPPTVLRNVQGEEGAVQLWVEDAMTETERSRRDLDPPDHQQWRRQHQIMDFFDALVHNADRNTGNRLIDADWQLWMIDHTRAFQRPRGRNTFPEVQQVPRFLWERFQQLDEEDVRARLSPYLSHLQMASLLGRRRDLEEHVRLLIEERGEGAVIIP